jgi:hypothetical protein
MLVRAKAWNHWDGQLSWSPTQIMLMLRFPNAKVETMRFSVSTSAEYIW